MRVALRSRPWWPQRRALTGSHSLRGQHHRHGPEHGRQDLHEVRVDSDAGTPGNEADDFFLTRTIGDDLLNAGETWTFVGSYQLGDEDTVSVVIAEALSPTNEPVDDVEACQTDIIQPPVPGVRAGVAPVSGKVLVKLPGSNTLVALEGQTEIPIGAQVDTRQGAVRLISGSTGSTQSAATATQSAVFSEGLFTIRQKRGARAVMNLILGGGNFGVCRGGGSAQPVGATPRRPVRSLWGSGKGASRPRREQRGDRPRDAVAHARALRRHADPRDAGRRQRPGLPSAARRSSSKPASRIWLGLAVGAGASNPSAAATSIDQIFTGS